MEAGKRGEVGEEKERERGRNGERGEGRKRDMGKSRRTSQEEDRRGEGPKEKGETREPRAAYTIPLGRFRLPQITETPE